LKKEVAVDLEAEAEAVLEAEAVEETSDHERCTRQHALSAEKNAKSHSSHAKENQYSAKNATRRRRAIHIPKFAYFFSFFNF
jgi:hypothetical protein